MSVVDFLLSCLFGQKSYLGMGWGGRANEWGWSPKKRGAGLENESRGGAQRDLGVGLKEI